MHGRFTFDVQKYKWEGASSTYFSLTDQFSERYVSHRLEEFVAYYSNRMSYEEVAKLVARNQGECVLSDQGIWLIVTTKAQQMSEQIDKETTQTLVGHEFDSLRINTAVDIYDKHESEILLFDDGIQVKGQRANRRKKNQQHDIKALDAEEETKSPRVNTDVIVLERASGAFEHIIAPLGAEEGASIPLSDVVKARVIEQYGSQNSQLNIVAITDGARSIRTRLETIFPTGVVIILDWYHLCKKVRALMSMIARNRQEKSEHFKFIFYNLWRGETDKVIDYLNNHIQARNLKKLEELTGYIQKHKEEIINYERRKAAGKTIGSGRVEKAVDRVVGYRQKKKGMSWSNLGSHALAILKVIELNGDWHKMWFPIAAPS